MTETSLARALATLLEAGTWVASLIIAIGLFMPGTPLVLVGVALFVALPVVRVAVMLAVFVRRRDTRFAIITGAVLAVIALGVVLGLRSRALLG